MRKVSLSPLTNEQREMAANNHNLIYSFLWEHQLDADEWYDVAAIGLCKACIKFDESRGAAFSTYAYFVMLNEINTVRNKKTPLTISWETEIAGIENASLGDTLGEEFDYTAVEVENIIGVFTRKLTEKQKQCFYAMLQGIKCADMAKKHGVSRNAVSMRYINIRDKFRRFCADNGIAINLPE